MEYGANVNIGDYDRKASPLFVACRNGFTQIVEKLFYLLVNSWKKENNRVESSVDDFLLSLSKLWTYIALESGRNSVNYALTLIILCVLKALSTYTFNY
jgi:hypothetical protein